MKTYALCPISDRKINEAAARISAIMGFGLMLAFTYTQNIIIVIFLAVDFLFRATGNTRFSLIGLASGSLVRYLPFEDRFINAGPKLFSAQIGFVITGLILLASLISLSVFSYTLVAILALFSFLEGVFGMCVACKIYPVLYKAFYNRRFRG